MGDKFDRDSWERRWSAVLSDGAHAVAQHRPNSDLLAEVEGLRPGRALDAGSGHGAETLWLAERGWQVTAVDFSATALGHAQAGAEQLGTDIAKRIEWIEADLETWIPPAHHYDLVICIYVHVAGSVDEIVARLAAAVAPGGTLLLIGRRPIDPATGSPSPAADQVQFSVEQVLAVLDRARWEIDVAEERPKKAAGAGVDAVVRATARY